MRVLRAVREGLEAFGVDGKRWRTKAGDMHLRLQAHASDGVALSS